MTGGSAARGVPAVAYQGEAGAFSEIAILTLWDADARPVPCATFGDVVAAVAAGRADLGLLPVENTIAGPVRDSVDAIAAAPLTIVRTIELPIRLCLLGVAGATLESLRTVESHPVALGQCAAWRAAHPGLAAREAYDTAGAARAVAAAGDPTRGAIASARAGHINRLVVIAEGLEDRADNTTRFVVLARAPGHAGADASADASADAAESARPRAPAR